MPHKLPEMHSKDWSKYLLKNLLGVAGLDWADKLIAFIVSSEGKSFDNFTNYR